MCSHGAPAQPRTFPSSGAAGRMGGWRAEAQCSHTTHCLGDGCSVSRYDTSTYCVRATVLLPTSFSMYRECNWRRLRKHTCIYTLHVGGYVGLSHMHECVQAVACTHAPIPPTLLLSHSPIPHNSQV